MATPISGKDGIVKYGSTTVAVTGWTRKPTCNAIDVSNTSDGRKRIAGLPDVTGSFTCHVDTAATYETGLVPGTIVALKFYTDATNFFSEANCIITDVDYSNEVEGTYDATYNWALASGTPDTAPGSS